MLCTKCKKEIKDGSGFCKHCGNKVIRDSEISFCASCGKQVKTNSLFCKHCGASIGNEKSVPKKDNKYKNVSLAIIIALLAIVCLLVFPRNEKEISKQFVGSTYNGVNTNPDNPGGSTGGIDNPGGGTGGIGNPGGGMPGKPLDNNDCFICGGDGKKDCTSCDGGYTVEYESGSYLGYGPTTREVRKKCMVCKGNGEVNCYH